MSIATAATDRSPLRNIVEKLVKWCDENSNGFTLEFQHKYAGPDYFWTEEEKKRDIEKMKAFGSGAVGPRGWLGPAGTIDGPSDRYYSPTIILRGINSDMLDKISFALSDRKIPYTRRQISVKSLEEPKKSADYDMIFNMLKSKYPDLNEMVILSESCRYLKSLLYEPEKITEFPITVITFDLLPNPEMFETYRSLVDQITKMFDC